MIIANKFVFYSFGKEEIFQGRRALSNMIAVVILILVMLSAFVVLFGVVRMVVVESTGEISIGRITEELRIKNAFVDGNIVHVVVERGAGKNPLAEIKFIFTNEAGETEIIERRADLKALETYEFKFNYLGWEILGPPVKVNIVPVIREQKPMAEPEEVVGIKQGEKDVVLISDEGGGIRGERAIKTAQIMFDSPSSLDSAEQEQLAKSIDLGISAKYDLRQFNPDFKGIKYTMIKITFRDIRGCIHCYDSVEKWFDEKDYDIEKAFIHYDEDSVLQINGQRIEVLGYDKADDKKDSRVMYYSDGYYSYIPNFKSEKYAEYLRDKVSESIEDGYAGIFFDENVVPNFPISDNREDRKLISGGKIREYPEDYRENNLRDTEYYSDGIKIIEGLEDNFPNLIFISNVGEYMNREEIEQVTKFVLREHFIRLDREFSKIKFNYVKEQSEKGIKQILLYNKNSAELSMDENRIFALALYYLMQTPNTYFGINAMNPDDAEVYKLVIEGLNGQNYGHEKLTKNLFEAVEVSIGEPLGEYYVYDDDEEVYKREYGGGLVFARLKYAGSDFEIALGEDYGKLNADGSIEVVDRIILGAPEGVVLVKI